MGTVAYPWLASAVTRSPALIALVAVVQRLPWLVFTLPAGVLTDRLDRRRILVAMDTIRGVVTAALALAVLGAQGTLPAPEALTGAEASHGALYALILLATLLLGTAEVLRDNAAQAFLPSVVDAGIDAGVLERANGRMWSAESAANTFVGPPLGSLLLTVAFSLPVFIDAGTFFSAAALVALIPGTYRATTGPPPAQAPAPSWRAEMAEGVRWLWGHELLRTMAVVLGLMNLAGALAQGTLVLYAQEVLDAGPGTFALIGVGGGIGAVVGGVLASWLARRLGAGACLALTVGGGAVVTAAMGLLSSWPGAFVLFGALSVLAVLWNVITVSLRQALVPGHLLGRVNSVYRFFGWGMIPIGSAAGGAVVSIVDTVASRTLALRTTWVVGGVLQGALLVVTTRRLTTDRIEAARTAPIA